MKLEVNISKKLGVINITSNSFVLEDLKAHICKKMKLNENDFKMEISFGDVPKVEMIEVKHEIMKEDIKIVDFILDGQSNLVSSLNDFYPIEFRNKLYLSIGGKKLFHTDIYNEHWLNYFKEHEHNSIVEIHENDSKKLLYKIRVIKQPSKKPKGSQDSNYREWIEEQKDFLRILWSGREMSSISDIQDNTSFYNQDNTGFCIYALSKNERIELVQKKPHAWENIQEYGFIFRLKSLYISLKGSEVYISSMGGFKYKIFNMKSESSVNAFMRGAK